MKLVGKEKTTSLIIYRQVWSSNDIYPFYLKPWFITKGGPQACNFVKSKLQHRCFPVNIAKFLRTAFFIEHLRRLLLSRMETCFLHAKQKPSKYLIILTLQESSWSFRHPDEKIKHSVEPVLKEINTARWLQASMTIRCLIDWRDFLKNWKIKLLNV